MSLVRRTRSVRINAVWAKVQIAARTAILPCPELFQCRRLLAVQDGKVEPAGVHLVSCRTFQRTHLVLRCAA